jgi:NAD(P)H-hydrate epimerase
MSLPPFLVGLPDAERMRATDRWAIEDVGIPGLELMERAGAGLAALVGEVSPDGAVAVVCGKGNNGGDGYVAARLLREAGREVRVLALADVEELRGDARANAERLPGAAPEPFAAGRLEGVAVAVDAVLGTGFAGEVRGRPREAIEALDASAVPVVAADVPSGVDASTGVVAGPAVRAAATATFGAMKPGLWVNPGKARAGEIRVVDLGIPPDAPVPAPDVGLLDDGPLLAGLPRREAGWTKFTSGHVLVAGGSRGLTGAPTMTAEAAARAGAGYVTVCAPESTQPLFAMKLVEVMSMALPEADGAHVKAGAELVLETADRRGGAIALGPGLGRTDGAVAFARRVTERAGVPLVLDADGLNAHAGALALLAKRRAGTVLTPHAGELGRLLEIDSDAVEAERLRHVRAAAAQAGAVVLLKGDDTLVARPDGLVAVSPGATPALATAGTGDVLTGVVATLLARGVEPFHAACAGARLHAWAGLVAAEGLGVDGVIATDVIAALPHARRRASEPQELGGDSAR